MGTVVYRQLDEIETVSTALRLLWCIIASTAMTIGASAARGPGADGPALHARCVRLSIARYPNLVAAPNTGK
ncbi:MAG: hypothetical protein JWO52_5544 [Gammaproteobacteria bacterium]|nr:hypothetical protein [Gammaproteobacteria bacterium]